jgi:hypothetical protein
MTLQRQGGATHSPPSSVDPYYAKLYVPDLPIIPPPIDA